MGTQKNGKKKRNHTEIIDQQLTLLYNRRKIQNGGDIHHTMWALKIFR